MSEIKRMTDPYITELAERYFDTHVVHPLRRSGVAEDALALMRRSYVRDVLNSPGAREQLVDWAADPDAWSEDERQGVNGSLIKDAPYGFIHDVIKNIPLDATFGLRQGRVVAVDPPGAT